MPGENLTRVEAIERKSIVATRSYEIELDLTTGPEVFRSRTVVRFGAVAGASTFIDAIATSAAEGMTTPNVGNAWKPSAPSYTNLSSLRSSGSAPAPMPSAYRQDGAARQVDRLRVALWLIARL